MQHEKSITETYSRIINQVNMNNKNQNIQVAFYFNFNLLYSINVPFTFKFSSFWNTAVFHEMTFCMIFEC